MFGARFFGKRYFGARYFGPANAQVLAPTGFSDGDSFGAPTITPGAASLAPTGYSDGDSFGSPTITTGATTLFPAGFADGDSFGSQAITTGAVALEPSGFADGDSFGSPRIVLIQYLSPTGFSDGDAFGGPHFGRTIRPTGFADGDAFGSHRLLYVLKPAGIPNIDLFGSPALKKKTGQGGGSKPGGVAAGQKYATPVTLTEDGLITSLSVQASVAKTINTRMALYSQASLLPSALIAQSAVKTSVVIGDNQYDLIVQHFGTTGQTYWIALHSDGNFNWFLSSGGSSRYNGDVFADGISNPFGASTVDNNKAPVFLLQYEPSTVTLEASGFANASTFGTPRLIEHISTAGFADADAFGSPAFAPGAVTLAPAGLADEDTIGHPVIGTNALVFSGGFANESAFGTPEITTGAVAIEPAGFANDSAFGSPAFEPGAVALETSGFADGDDFGAPTITQASFTLNASGFADGDAFGGPTIASEPPLPVDRANELKNRQKRDRIIKNLLEVSLNSLTNEKRIRELKNYNALDVD